jgi:glycosyltransferase involved in cell wall biosynthesis
MRILFLTPQLPYPPHQGTTMRNYGLIKGLSAHHQVSLLSFCEPGQSPSSDLLDPLLALCRQVETVPAPPPRSLVRRALDTLIHRLPDMALRLTSPAFAERLTAWLARESFDVVHVEGIEMTPYLDLLLGGAQQVRAASETGRGRGPLVIFDDHNCEYMLQKSYAQVDVRIPRRWAGALYSLIQWQKLRNYEASVCRRAHHVLAVSQTDAEALQQLVPDLDVTVIPNGIDTDQYETYCLDAVPDPVMSRAPGLVFTGKMDFRPNVDAVRWFAEMIWPQVRDAVPEARFFAVGQHPHPQLDDLGVDPSLTLTGWVEDVRPYIAAATVYVAPLRMGSGTRLKLLEAMALGKAIVSTRLGAEGLTDVGPGPPPGNARRAAPAEGGVTDDRELVLVADDDASAFANAVVALLGDPARRDRLGAAGKTFVKAHYDWRVIIPRLEALYVRD